MIISEEFLTQKELSDEDDNPNAKAVQLELHRERFWQKAPLHVEKYPQLSVAGNYVQCTDV